jgi:hypothetical protein
MSMFARIAKTLGEPTLKLYVKRLGTADADGVDADVFAGRLIRSSTPSRRASGRASRASLSRRSRLPIRHRRDGRRTRPGSGHGPGAWAG